MKLESRDYEKILNAMPETGVYVIRESDRGLLYFNKRVKEVSPEAQLGTPCYELWAGSCACCPLLTIGDRQESRSVSYNDPYGGVVDITATRTLWQGETPAFVVTVAPRVDSGGYTYRKLLRVNLERDTCDVLKSDPEGWQPDEQGLSGQLERFARSGAVYPEDQDRFVEFTRLDQLRDAVQKDEAGRNLLYRRQDAGGIRWNLMEVIPDEGGAGRFAILCIKDVHDVLREGQAREGVRSQDLIRILGEQNFHIYTIDLNSGSAELIRVDGQTQEGAAEPWDRLIREQVTERLHPDYRDEFSERFSLEGLRREWEKGQEKTELLGQWRDGGGYRYISAAAYFGRGRQTVRYAVLAIQDVDERMRRELAHTQRDMQMAAILKSRFKMMNTVDLATGQCERVDLSRPAGPENVLLGDYEHYIRHALEHVVHPEDAESFQAVLSLEHLREKAGATEDFAEEVCVYRQRGEEEEPRWIELRVIYTRQKDQVMVNILGQDVTRDKTREAFHLQALEERAAVISSLSSLFFSTYYMNLEQDTFRAVVQLRRVGDVLGEEVNCTAALQIYANHFIHPEDREAYLRVMNTRHLRDTLRWWAPCAAVEFRKMAEKSGEEHGGWVRATAVLAQTGPDDMPRTVVYVAQDIGESRRRTEENGERYG